LNNPEVDNPWALRYRGTSLIRNCHPPMKGLTAPSCPDLSCPAPRAPPPGARERESECVCVRERGREERERSDLSAVLERGVLILLIFPVLRLFPPPGGASTLRLRNPLAPPPTPPQRGGWWVWGSNLRLTYASALPILPSHVGDCAQRDT